MTNVQAPQRIGSRMPDFPLLLLDGGNVSLPSFLAGRKAVVVDVLVEPLLALPALRRLPEPAALTLPGVGLLAVASRQNESVQMLRAAVAEQ